MTDKFDPRQDEWYGETERVKIHWRRNSRVDRDRWPGRKVRVYVSTSDTFDVLEDLANRHRRPYKVWKPLVLETLRALGYSDVTIRWNQKAGCSCGCSPGFIVHNGLQHGLCEGDMWITTRKAEPNIDETKPARKIV